MQTTATMATASGGATPAPDFEELDAATARRLRQEAHATVDKSVDATRRMVTMAEETRQTGAKTLNMLNEQTGTADAHRRRPTALARELTASLAAGAGRCPGGSQSN